MPKRVTNEDMGQAPECPIAKILSHIKEVCGLESNFRNHMIQARIEFLKGIRSLLDNRIEALEKGVQEPEKSEASEIEVG
nr:hypothetical protein [Desulfobacterales bacterium]